MTTKKFISHIIFLGFISLVKAQDGYYGKKSIFIVNLSDPANTIFNFNYVMTGVIYSESDGYPFTLYVNTSDGSWAITGDAVEQLIGRDVISSDRHEKLDFIVHIPYKVTRAYYRVVEDGSIKKVYSEIKRGLWATASQLEFMREDKITRFLRYASVRRVRSHPNFGPQKSYTGSISSGYGNMELELVISTKSAPIKINPLHVGFLCGVFQDPTQKKNRFITLFKTPQITVEMNSFKRLSNVLDASEYSERRNAGTVNVESMEMNNDEIKAINERMAQLTQDLRGATRNPDRMRIITLKISIEAQKLRALKSGHPERKIPDDAAYRLIDLKKKIMDKTRECKRYRENSYEKRRCKTQLERLQREFKDIYLRYF